MLMKSIIFPLYALLWLCAFSFGNEDDRTKVEFFEKLYKTKITGVKLFDEYPDPDQFYSAIAKQVGIPQIACKAVEEKFGWKNDGKSFLSLMIKGGGNSDDWGVMVTKIPSSIKKLKGNIKNAKTEEEKKKFISERIELLKEMEMKMVVVGYDGKISFPEIRKKKSEKKISEKVE